MRFSALTHTVGIAILFSAGPAVAQDLPATGFAIWAKVPATTLQGVAAGVAGSPQFALGYRGNRASLGVAVGGGTLRITDESTFSGQTSKETLTGSAFQVGPAFLLDVWQSEDRLTHGNLALGVSWGRISVTNKDEFTGSTPSESKLSGTLIGYNVGIGGDHFIHQHFAIGLEGGFQGTIATGLEEEGDPSQKAGIGGSGAYGGLRLTVVF